MSRQDQNAWYDLDFRVRLRCSYYKSSAKCLKMEGFLWRFAINDKNDITSQLIEREI